MWETLAVSALAAVLLGLWIRYDQSALAQARKSALPGARAMLDELGMLDGLQSTAETRLSRAADGYRRFIQKKRLTDLPIEALKNHADGSIRWKALRSGGFHTVSDLRGVGAATLENLRGIGPTTADRVVRATKRAVATAQAKPVPPPTAPNSAAHTELLRAAVEIRAIDVCLLDLTPPGRCVEQLQSAVSDVKSTTSFLSWILGNSSSGLEAVDHLEVVSSSTDVQKTLTDVRSVHQKVQSALSTLRSTPLNNALGTDKSGYVAIARAALTGSSRPMPSASPPTRTKVRPARSAPKPTSRRPALTFGELPEAISKKVRGQSLITTSLAAPLSDQQQFGARFALCQERAILGDAAHLDKQLQLLAVMQHLFDGGRATHFLVVAAPARLRGWESRADEHTDLEPHTLTGAPARVDQAMDEWETVGGLAAVDFHTARQLPRRAPRLGMMVLDLDGLPFDEAMAAAADMRSLLETSAQRVIASRSAPMGQSPHEIAQLASVVDAPLGRRARAASTPQEAHRLLAPVYLRRSRPRA